MVVFTFIVLGMGLVVFQSSIGLIFSQGMLTPDLYYILVAYLAYRLDLFRSMLILFPLSWMLDIVSGIFLGFYPFLCFGGYFFLKITANQLPIRTSYFQIPFVGVSFFVVSWVLYLLISFFFPEYSVDGSWVIIGVRVILLLLLTPPFFRFFEIVRNTVSTQRPKNRLFKMKTGNHYR